MNFINQIVWRARTKHPQKWTVIELALDERFAKSILLKRIKDIGHSCQGIELVTCFFENIFYLTVSSCHVTYAFQSESTLYICLNVKELLSRNRREIWTLSDCNWTRTHNHLVPKQTLNHLAKLACGLGVRVQL